MNFQIDSNTLVITPNRRLARVVRNTYESSLLQAGKKSWATPQILPLKSWLATLWNELPDARILLTQEQESFLWHTIIANKIAHNSPTLAKLALEAWEIINEWELEYDSWLEQHLSEEIQSFVNWANEFALICQKRSWISQSQLPGILAKQLPNLNYGISAKIIFIGFLQTTPQLNSLVKALSNNNKKIEFIEFKVSNNSQKRISFASLEEELLTMARFAKKTHELHPQATIGCVVPDLLAQYSQIKRIFGRIFTNQGTFNVSGGEPFNRFSIISEALFLLNFLEPFRIEDLTKLLFSPFANINSPNLQINALLDIEFRLSQKLHFTFNETLELLEQSQLASKDPRVKDFSLLIDKLHTADKENQKIKQKPSAWARTYNRRLINYRWFAQQLTHAELQLVERWQKLLQEFSALDLVAKELTHYEAISKLQELTINLIYQNDSPPAPINILGTFEASGINFDYLWIAGMDSESWPPAIHPNPFIPLNLQHQKQIPHSSRAREFAYYEKVIKSFQTNAKHIIFSHLNQTEDRKLQPNPLILDAAPITLEDLELPKYMDPYLEIYQHRKLELIDDRYGNRVSPDEIIKGGTSILELQSLCPFRAFAKIRLRAEEMPVATVGIDAKQRGILIHRILESLFRHLPSQNALIQLSSSELSSLLTAKVQKIFDETDCNSRTNKFEKKAITKILLNFLQHEKTRIPFAIVATEQKIKFAIGGIDFNLRIDRIDKLADGSMLIIDYKTGNTISQKDDWLGERLKNIQLPLYCLATNGEYNIALAQINPERIRFKTISFSDLPYSKEELYQNWQTYLEKIAEDFLQGKACVDPIDTKICECCKLDILCGNIPGAIST